MSTLLFRLEGPLQSWGASSRFTERSTRSEPTKSGIVGLIAAAQGREREDSVADLAALRFGVRADQPGTLTRELHTVLGAGSKKDVSVMTHRSYLADAKFLAAIEGDEAQLIRIKDALSNPVYPLFLGRRSCPPSGPLHTYELLPGSLETELDKADWIASRAYKRQFRATETVSLAVVRDTRPGEDADEIVRDSPLRFTSSDRRFGWRSVALRHAFVHNDQAIAPEGADTTDTTDTTDWLAAL